ncbi:MAG TPA: DUF4126 domain-containing protein [Longimicrobiales bacterium]|nr:DUF4126 domain-containing protein [Longimicrobiales bacterium]
MLGGQLLGTAFACGLNLYATVALLGIASRLHWVAELPPGMRGLENGLIIGAAIGLYLAGFIAHRISWVDTVWEAVHTVIRPGAAGLLAALAFQGTPLPVQAGVAAAAVLTALMAHGTKAGVRLILLTRPRPVLRTLAVIAEDAAAVGIATAVLLVPHTTRIIVGVALAFLLLAGPRLWRAAFMGLHTLLARGRGFFRGRGWRSREQMPRALRDAVPVPPLGRSPTRAQAATLHGMRGVGPYRNGWLVFTCDGPRFVYRSILGTRTVELPRAAGIDVTTGILNDVLRVETNGRGPVRSFTLYLRKDGPPADVTAAELASDTP